MRIEAMKDSGRIAALAKELTELCDKHELPHIVVVAHPIAGTEENANVSVVTSIALGESNTDVLRNMGADGYALTNSVIHYKRARYFYESLPREESGVN